MTAEIGILNKIGVALAADSAVTVNNGEKEKVFNYANKLFSISENHSIGIMIYGNANFMGVPWETIIKLYRGVIGKTPLSHVENYNDNFIQYLSTNNAFTSERAENHLIYYKFNELLKSFLNQLNETLNEKIGISPPENTVRQIMYGEAHAFRDVYSSLQYSNDFNHSDVVWFLEHKTDLIDVVLDRNIFIVLDDETREIFRELAAYIIFKDILFGSNTGLVISGFGEDEIFPSLYESIIEGIYNGKLKYKHNNLVEINNNDGNTAAILPFAQQEMVHSFLNGVDPSLKESIEKELHGVLTNLPGIIAGTLDQLGRTENESSLNSEETAALNKVGSELFALFQKEILDYQHKYSTPITDTVEFLPKEELASMAEALVNLTSLKRKVTIEAETVGGPIDVAVITKGDGFVWIKRKHYFDPSLNAQFFRKY